jgi:hypothetical protein
LQNFWDQRRVKIVTVITELDNTGGGSAVGVHFEKWKVQKNKHRDYIIMFIPVSIQVTIR